MTTIVCNELKTTLTQSVNMNYDRVYHVAGLKIQVFMYNNPTGIFTLSIKSGSDVLANASFTSADIKTDLNTTDNYAYIYKALDFSLPLKKGSYDLVLSSDGYTFSESSFLGWCKSYDNVFNQEVDADVVFTRKPYNYLIYENTREDLTR